MFKKVAVVRVLLSEIALEDASRAKARREREEARKKGRTSFRVSLARQIDIQTVQMPIQPSLLAYMRLHHTERIVS